MPKVVPRDVSYFFQFLRTKLLGRVAQQHLRFPDALAARTQPPPFMPPGPHSKLHNNYYYARDGRRKVELPEKVYEAGDLKQLTEPGKNKDAGTSTTSGIVSSIPGRVYNWD